MLNFVKYHTVLGGTGMLGSAVREALVSKYDHFCVSNVGSQVVDLENFEAVSKFFYTQHKETAIYHCAGYVGGIGKNKGNDADFLMKNSLIALNVIQNAIYHGINNFYYIASSCMYPVSFKAIRENNLLEGPLEKTNEGYAIAKIVGVKMCEYLFRQGKDYRSFVPCNLYGPGDNFGENGHVLSSLVRKIYTAAKDGSGEVEIWGTGSPLREFLHVRDCASAILEAIEKTNVPYINIGSGVGISIYDLANIIAKELNWKGKFYFNTKMPNGVYQKVMDVSMLTATGWKPQISLEQGVALQIKEYEKSLQSA